MYNFYEPISTYGDPLLNLLQARGEFTESDEDELLSMYSSALHRAKTAEVERIRGDLLGASPTERGES